MPPAIATAEEGGEETREEGEEREEEREERERVLTSR